MKNKIVAGFIILLAFTGTALGEGKTGLPFDLDYSMSKERAIDQLKAMDANRIQDVPNDTIAYAVHDFESNTVNALFVKFSNDKLVEITSTKTGMNNELYERYMRTLLDQAKVWVDQGMEVLMEDKNENDYIYKNNSTVVSIMGGRAPNESGKFEVNLTYYEVNYFDRMSHDSR